MFSKKMKLFTLLFALHSSVSFANGNNRCFHLFNRKSLPMEREEQVYTQQHLNDVLQTAIYNSHSAFKKSKDDGVLYINSERLVYLLEMSVSDIRKFFLMARDHESNAIDFAEGVNNAISVFISNLERREMSSTQRVLIAAKILPLYKDLLDYFPNQFTELKLKALDKLGLDIRIAQDREIYRSYFNKIMKEPDTSLPYLWRVQSIESRINFMVPRIFSETEAQDLINRLKQKLAEHNPI